MDKFSLKYMFINQQDIQRMWYPININASDSLERYCDTCNCSIVDKGLSLLQLLSYPTYFKPF